MHTVIIEATNVEGGGINWGKFLVGRFEEKEWAYRSTVNDMPLIRMRGWTHEHVFVLDLQTGEGAMFLVGGHAEADLDKHRVWVCPLFEPFLTWLYRELPKHDGNLRMLPPLVKLDDAPSAMYGHRRRGPRPNSTPTERPPTK